MRVLVVADDLTGACDTGVQFARSGRPCSVAFLPRLAEDERRRSHLDAFDRDIVIVDTESRHVPPHEAASRVRSVVSHAGSDTIVLKKIDSTFRGNVASEVGSALGVLRGRIGVVVPAYPAGGRTTVGGRCLVHGIPLDATEFAHDPLSPVTTASVADLVGCSAPVRRDPTGRTPVRDPGRRSIQASGSEAVRKAVHDASPGDIIIVDATTQDEIDAVLSVVADDLHRVVFIGSAGLASAIGHGLLGHRGHDEPEELRPVARRPVLGVVGSLSGRTRAQVDWLVSRGGATRFVCGLSDATDVTAAATEALRSGCSVVLVSPDDRLQEAAAVARRLARSAGAVLARFGALWQPVAARRPLADPAPPGLVLTGGETALAVLRDLGVDRVDVVRELAPGVPVLGLYGRRYSGPAVSKAGGFGGDDILIHAFRHLEEGR